MNITLEWADPNAALNSVEKKWRGFSFEFVPYVHWSPMLHKVWDDREK